MAPELRRIWEEILGCPAGDEESFFGLAGNLGRQRAHVFLSELEEGDLVGRG